MIAVISDCHVHNFRPFGGVKVSGINERCNMSLASIAQAVAIANEAEAELLVVTGDLFDVSDPTPQIIAATLEVMQEFQGGDVVLLVGNHDQFSLAEGDHALGPFQTHTTRGGQFRVIERAQTVDWHSVGLPFNPEPVQEWLSSALEKYSGVEASIVFGHFGIIDEDTEAFLRGAPDAIEADVLFSIMKKRKIKMFVVGNWHEHRIWKRGERTIVQVGALTPTGFGNLGRNYGRVVLIDNDCSVDVREVNGPRFHKIKWGDKVPRSKKHQLFVHCEAKPNDVRAARAWFKEQAERYGIAGFNVVPSKEQAQARARAAAKATSQESAIKAASAAFVGKMPMPEGVSRERVLAHVLRYLGGRR